MTQAIQPRRLIKNPARTGCIQRVTVLQNFGQKIFRENGHQTTSIFVVGDTATVIALASAVVQCFVPTKHYEKQDGKQKTKTQYLIGIPGKQKHQINIKRTNTTMEDSTTTIQANTLVEAVMQ